ncbi:MAG: Rieske (2Fe-2S) protein [Verrucomicrobia bacterium]|jgi:Rieske Fe-S protein|nr:Rieske (2Fe-2S) protein [Verrucomicrobiota bacterium]
MTSSQPQPSDSGAQDGGFEPVSRRGFLHVLALLTTLGGFLGSLLVACLRALLPSTGSPSSSGSTSYLKVTQLDKLPADGIPRSFQIIADHWDAWNRHANQPIGMIWLCHRPDGEILAWSRTCPHAGCLIQLARSQDHFQCPCHNSRFEIDGSRSHENSPSPRDMDRLEVEIRYQDQIWVNFIRFKSGISEQESLLRS